MKTLYFTIMPIVASLDAARATGVVLRHFLKSAAENAISPSVVFRKKGTESGAVERAVVTCNGEDFVSFRKEWLGTIKWRAKGKSNRNFYVQISAIDLPKHLLEQPSTITFEAIRASGPGGQHVNKVSTAIRATHPFSGITLVASEHRSQLQNKATATLKIQKKIAEWKENQLVQWLENQSVNTNIKVRNQPPVKEIISADFRANHKKDTVRTERKSFRNNSNKLLNDSN